MDVPGISVKLSERILALLGYSPETELSQMSKVDVSTLQTLVMVIQRQYEDSKVPFRGRRGIRLQKGLPVRGQRTRSNAKTVKALRKG